MEINGELIAQLVLIWLAIRIRWAFLGR